MYKYYTEEFSIFVSLREEYLNCVFFFLEILWFVCLT